ncbi:MAG: ABC transporter permease subunit [Clostridiales bacterium]|nr:ABC transporter permease subunit [Clostridiales bacterium]
MLAVFKREFLSYFRSPVGYVALALFSFLSGYIFVSLFGSGEVNLAVEINLLTRYFMIIIPIITMGLFSEDKKRGTEVLYYSSPVSLFSVVMGKFLAALSLFAVLFVNVIIHMIITAMYGGVVDINAWGSVIVYFFLAALFIAIGVFASALTDNQIIAAIISFVIILAINLLSYISGMAQSAATTIATSLGSDVDKVNTIGERVAAVINWFDPLEKTKNFLYGIFSVAPLIFCLSFTLVFLFLTYRVLEKKRWSQG